MTTEIKLPWMNVTELPDGSIFIREGHTLGNIPDRQRNGYFLTQSQAEQILEALEDAREQIADTDGAINEIDLAIAIFTGEKK